MKDKPTVSVVIPTYNEATYVDRLLHTLAKQNFDDFEVIVSDARSNDGIKKVVDHFKNKLNIKLVQTPPKGPAAGRNAGAAKANGEWLLFLDADIDTDDTNFIKTLIEDSQKNGWQTATSAYRLHDASILEKVGASINYYYIRLLAHTKHPVAPGFCILTKRGIFNKNGGFDKELYFGEDYDYVSRTSYGGFGFVTKTYYYQDLRRFRQGNQFEVFFKNVLAEVYRHTHSHRIDKPPFKYEFGKHKDRDQN